MGILNNNECFLPLLQLLTTDEVDGPAVLNAITTFLNYTCITLRTTEAYNLYLHRRDLVERKEDVKEQFDNVLQCLSDYSEEEVRLHMICLGKLGLLIFTGINTECGLGYITLDSSSERKP